MPDPIAGGPPLPTSHPHHTIPPLDTSSSTGSLNEGFAPGFDEISKVLILYTGGTIGMKNMGQHGYTPVPGFLSEVLSSMRRFHDPDARLDSHSRSCSPRRDPAVTESHTTTRQYSPVNLPLKYVHLDEEMEIFINGTPIVRSRLPAMITPLSLYGKRIKFSILEYDPLMDSSNMTMKDWVKIATDIEVNYSLYDAFVVLHGTDTMAYTASALSFMLEDLGKTVILTGSQVPLAEVRNDAVENLLGALTIAGHFIIPEVTLFFSHKLYRGNRSSKVNAFDLNAFDSPNFRPLVSVGINIDVNWADVNRPTAIAKFRAEKRLNPSVAALRLFPGITEATVRAFLGPSIKGIVLETFGSGNAPNNRPELLKALKEASDRGVCRRGIVTDFIGVVPGSDMTTECALTKLSYLIGKGYPPSKCRDLMRQNLRGELTVLSAKPRFTHSQRTHNLVQSVLTLLNANPSSSLTLQSSPAVTALLNDMGDGAMLERVLVPMLLCNACRSGDMEGLKIVAEEFGTMVSQADYDGRTPLHIAASENQMEAVKILLSRGANVHVRDRYGHSPLYDAVRSRHQKVASVLREAGAHFAEDEEDDVAAVLASAGSDGDLEQFNLVVDCGFDVNCPWLDGRTPLHLAVLRKRLNIVAFCVGHTERIVTEPQPPLSLNDDAIAVSETGDEVLGCGTKIEIKLDPKDNFGNTPLDLAIALKWDEGIQCLERGLRVLAKARG
ncbi:asparaginase-domain-containing protein [Chytridium lagenaria]|nr:asparaginase-domain-containing protein [Chytridium lagenaria]